ncbi:MAG: hybrid sensor histidine kinase/response regulator, partial [Pseudomonadota bacterium]
TGLGLATAAMQVQSVGGAIALTSAPGQGTLFQIYWPLHRRGGTETNKPLAADHNLRDMMIIVIDDDPDVSSVIGSYLEACGAEVAICEDPRDGIEAVKEDPSAWSAVITDYDMPIMNGGAVVEQLRHISKDLPIFVVTALARRLSDPRIIDGQTQGIFSKPVELEALTQTLATTIRKR